MKKVGIIMLTLFIVLSLLTLVSAQLDLRQGSEQIINWIQEMFGPFLEVLFGNSDYVFEKFLFFFIIMAFVYVALSKSTFFDDYPGAIWLLAIVVSFVSTRYLTQVQYFIGLLIPYTVLGVVLTAGVPLLIMFFFIESLNSGVLRKIFWIFYVVVFAGIWLSQYSEVGPIGWAYFFSGIAAFFFLLFDGTIRRALVKQEMKQLNINSRRTYEREIKRQMDEARADMNKNIISSSEYRRLMRQLNKKLKAVRKM